jgi:hypothetical protein
MSHTITRLPYLGRPAAQRRASKSPILEINMSALSKHQEQELENKLSDLTDPYLVFTNKVTHLAEMLDCTEREAERIILARL